jgi:exodeoxyribonuclease V beta subunit
MKDAQKICITPIRDLDLVNCPLDGRNMVEAAAGTGKTFAITRLYLRLLLERNLLPHEILVVTFTEAATSELRERIRATLETAHQIARNGATEMDDPFFIALFERLPRYRACARLSEALHSFDSAAIHTIHGFCRQVLFEHAFESGSFFAAEIISDEQELIELIAADFWRRHFYNASPLFLAYAAAEKCSGPSWFSDLYKIRKGVEAYRLLPQSPEDQDTSGLEVQLKALIDKTAPIWNDHRVSITALLTSPSLKQNSYSPKIVTKLFGRINELFERGFIDQEGIADLKKVTAGALYNGTKKGAIPPSHPFFDACEELYSCLAALHEAFQQKFLALKILFLSTAGTTLVKEKERRSLLGFDDLLLRVSSAFADKKSGNRLRSALQAAYKAALIDEFQDTDSVQYLIFAEIFGLNLPLFFIGDPKQAIYRFRGADIHAYFEASQNASARYTLSINYRSDPLLLEAINRLFIGHGNPFAFKRVEYRPVRAGLEGNTNVLSIAGVRQKPFVLWLFKRDSTDSVEPLEKALASNLVTSAVTGEIGHLLSAAAQGAATIGDHPLRPSDIAVLVRTNREAALVRKALGIAHIPAILYMSGSVFGSFEAAEFEILLAALAEPQRNELLRAALATCFFGLSANEINGLESDDHLWSSFQSRIVRYHEEWRTGGILPMLRKLMNDEQVRRRLLPSPEGERKLTNLLHLAELLHAEALRSRAGMAAMVKWLSVKRLNYADNVPPDEEMLRLESDEEAVRIVTIHKSKGLEYPIVFCPFTWNASMASVDKNHKKPFIFHDPDHDFAASIALGADAIRQFQPIADEELLAESVRLLYVAITRAKVRCYCAWGPVKGAEISALAWVLFGRHIDNNPVAQLRAIINGLSDRAMSDGLTWLRSDADACIEIAPLPECSPFVLSKNDHVRQSVTARPFRGTIAAPRRIFSYSALAHSMPLSDREWTDDGILSRVLPVEGREPIVPAVGDFNDFPRGAEAGNFLHSVLEEADFCNPSSQKTSAAIAAGLARFGFAPTLQSSVERMIRTVAETMLDPESGLRLDCVPLQQCSREMEFYFPVQPFIRRDIFEAASEVEVAGNILLPLPELISSGGHLKGYIDLVFEWQDHFYIIDWKSNHLGDGNEAYSPTALIGVMAREHYLLQYHLYAVALHRYLQLRKPRYSYEKNFGGIYYLFLRGLGKVPENRNGIFFDRPDEERIIRLCGLLTVKKPKHSEAS